LPVARGQPQYAGDLQQMIGAGLLPLAMAAP